MLSQAQATRLFLDPRLVEEIRNLWHPRLPDDAIELAFRRQLFRLIHRSHHHISELMLCTGLWFRT